MQRKPGYRQVMLQRRDSSYVVPHPGGLRSKSKFVAALRWKAGPFFSSLSAAKQNALLTCLDSDGLQKGPGGWRGSTGAAIAGVTVADLGRDGLLVINRSRDIAGLTENGLLAMGWHHKAARLAASRAVDSGPSTETTIPAR